MDSEDEGHYGHSDLESTYSPSPSGDREVDDDSEFSDSDESISSSRMAELERLDRLSDLAAGQSDAESDESDDVIIRTGDEIPPIPTASLIDDRRRLVYSPETLMRLIPEHPEFDGLREKLRIQKTEYKFDLEVSNKRYEADYYREHNAAPNKSLKRFKVTYRGDELDRFYGQKHPFSKKGLFRPKPGSAFKRQRPSGRKLTVSEPKRNAVAHPVRVHGLPPSSVLRKIAHVAQYKHFVVLSEIGGISKALRLTVPDWYRIRKGLPFKHGNTVYRAFLRGSLKDNAPQGV